MSVKLVVLKSGENLISDVKELISEEKICGYLLESAYKIEYKKPLLLVEEGKSPSGEIEIILSPWILLTSDDKIPISPEWVVTIVEPIDSVKEMYEEKVNGTEHKVSFIEE